jgi:hypothetical protein
MQAFYYSQISMDSTAREMGFESVKRWDDKEN